jgi:guanylate kinase
LKDRLESRATDSSEVIAKRLRNAEKEMARAGEYMFRVTNDDLDVAFRRLCDIINTKAELI